MIMDNENKEQESVMSLEENFEKLEELIETMSDDQISLEDAFQAYTKGMELLKTCSEQIDRVEKKVLVISGEGQMQELEDMGAF